MPVDATKKEVESIMKRFGRPIILERLYENDELLPGGCLLGVHFERFTNLEVGRKLLLIRYWLEDMYGDEYSRANIARSLHYSYQGIKNVETCSRKKNYDKTITALVDEYHVSKEVILGTLQAEDIPQGICIGKPNDMTYYFNQYYLEHGKNHVLDLTDYSKFDWGDHTGGLQEVSIELVMRLRDPDTGEILNTRNITQVKLSGNDLNRISDIIVRDMEMAAYKHKEIMRLKEEIYELEQLLFVKERSAVPHPNIDKDTLKRFKAEVDRLRK